MGARTLPLHPSHPPPATAPSPALQAARIRPFISLPNAASDTTFESGHLIIILEMKDQALPGT